MESPPPSRPQPRKSLIETLIEDQVILPLPPPEDQKAHFAIQRCEKAVDAGLDSRMVITVFTQTLFRLSIQLIIFMLSLLSLSVVQTHWLLSFSRPCKALDVVSLVLSSNVTLVFILSVDFMLMDMAYALLLSSFFSDSFQSHLSFFFFFFLLYFVLSEDRHVLEHHG